MANMTLFNHALRLLYNHMDANIREPIIRASFLLDAGQVTDACILLHEAADVINPYKRTKTSSYRQLCLESSYKQSYRCVVAQLFYEMSELFRGQQHSPYLFRVAGKKIPVNLT